MPKDRGAEQGDVDGSLECSLAREWWQPKHGCVLPLTCTLPWVGIDDPVEERRLQAEHENKMQKIPKFHLGYPENTCPARERRLDKSLVHRRRRYPLSPDIVPTYLQKMMQPTTKFGAERNPQKRPRLSGKLTRCACWPLSRRWPLEATRSELLWDSGSSLRINSWPKQMSFELCTIVFSCVRTHRQNLFSYAKVLASAVSTTSFGCTATRSCKRNELLKSTMRLDKGPLGGSSQDSRRTARCKPHSAKAKSE